MGKAEQIIFKNSINNLRTKGVNKCKGEFSICKRRECLPGEEDDRLRLRENERNDRFWLVALCGLVKEDVRELTVELSVAKQRARTRRRHDHQLSGEHFLCCRYDE